MLFNQLLFQIVEGVLYDELGDVFFDSLIVICVIDSVLFWLVGDVDLFWWDDCCIECWEICVDIVRVVWNVFFVYLCGIFGNDLFGWLWGKVYILIYEYVLGQQVLFKCFFNVGLFVVFGIYEVLNNLLVKIGLVFWVVIYGLLIWCLVDFVDLIYSFGINLVGQSGVFFDGYYDDQVEVYIEGYYLLQYYEENEVKVNSKGVLVLELKC